MGKSRRHPAGMWPSPLLISAGTPLSKYQALCLPWARPHPSSQMGSIWDMPIRAPSLWVTVTGSGRDAGSGGGCQGWGLWLHYLDSNLGQT